MKHLLPPPRSTSHCSERLIEWLLRLAALSSIAVTLGIVGVLLLESARFFRTLADSKYAPALSHLAAQAVRIETADEETLLILTEPDGRTVRLSLDPDFARRLLLQLAAEPSPVLQLRVLSTTDLELQVDGVATRLSFPEGDLQPLVEGRGSLLAALAEFLGSTTWTPLFADPSFGILPLVCATLLTTCLALLIALPLGSLLAIYLSEYAPFQLRNLLKPLLEVLGAVPTVIYGYFALQVITPLLQQLIPGLPTFNLLSAGLALGLMILPYVASLSEDALRAVPMLLREGSYALGANRLITAVRVVYPAALSGIGAAYALGISRALGETMIVAIAAGMQSRLTVNPLDSAQCLAGFLVQASLGDLPAGSIGYQALFAVGLVLFLLTLLFNLAGYLLRQRFQEVC
jgi:phosphate transport system permease protein